VNSEISQSKNKNGTQNKLAVLCEFTKADKSLYKNGDMKKITRFQLSRQA